jgi:hypothetical protein
VKCNLQVNYFHINSLKQAWRLTLKRLTWRSDNTGRAMAIHNSRQHCLHAGPLGQFIIITPSPESASELYRPSDRRLSVKLVQTFGNRGCRVVSATDPHGRILRFLDRNRYFFLQVLVTPQLCSRGRVDPVPDPLLLRKSGNAENRIRTSGSVSQELWPLDHRGGLLSPT